MQKTKMLQDIFSERGPVFRFFWPVTHYIVTHLFVMAGYIHFNIFNRTIVSGRKNVPHSANILLLSNHQTMVDSFLVGMSAFFPHSLLNPSLLPWNPAAEENFYGNAVQAWFADNWGCIRVKRGRKDISLVNKMKIALEQSPVTLFPEGTRSRNSEIRRGKAGAGLVILYENPIVIPVCIDGMDAVLPIGSVLPRFGKRIYISYGKAMDFSEFTDSPKDKANAQAVINKVMDEIKLLQSDIRQKRRKISKGYQNAVEK